MPTPSAVRRATTRRVFSSLASRFLATVILGLLFAFCAPELRAQGGPPFIGIVSPKGAPQNIDIQPGDRTVTFQVTNVGSQGGSGALQATCSGVVMTGCYAVPGFISLSTGQSSASVTVHYQGTGATGPGKIYLRFNPQQAPYTPDSGWFNVTAAVPPPPVAITVVATPSNVTLPGGRSDQSVGYTLNNGGATDMRVLLRGTCSGAPLVSVCSSTMSEVYVPAHDSVPARVNVTTTSGGGTGATVSVIASDPATGADLTSGSASVSTTPAPAAIVTVKTFQAGPNVERSLCPTFAVTAIVASQCGAIRIIHALPSVTTYGKTYTPTLAYYQDNTEGTFILVDVSLPSVAIPPQVQVNVYNVSPNGDRQALAASKTIPGTNWNSTRSQRINLRDLGATSGQLATFDVEVRTGDGTNWTLAAPVVRGQIIPVIRNPYHAGSSTGLIGSGWSLLGLDELVPGQPGDTVTWIGGDGSTRKYTPRGTTAGITAFTTVNYFGPDTLYRIADGTFQSPLAHGAMQYFDASGRHTSTKDRFGRSTIFGYDPVELRRLRTITVPGNLVYSFDYPAAELTITAPGNRIVHAHRALGPHGIGDIVDPDNSVVRFYYPGPWGDGWAIVGITDKRGMYTGLGWADYGKTLEQSRSYLSTSLPAITSDFGIAIGRGAAPYVASTDPALPDYSYDGPRLDVSDVTQIWTDSLGAVTRSVNALGQISRIEHGDPRFPGLATKVTAPNDFVTNAAYDARGHVAIQTSVNPLDDGRNATTTYKWDMRWDHPTKITRPAGDFISLGYRPADGLLDWSEDARGSVSRTTYAYNADKQLTSVTPPGVTCDISGYLRCDQMQYDPTLHNVLYSWTPTGIRTEYHRDPIGRVTSTLQEIVRGNQVKLRVDSLEIDVMDRVYHQTTTGPELTTTRSPSVTFSKQIVDVTQRFDAGGLLTRMGRRSSPDSAGIGDVYTRWTYDALGRDTAEYAPDATPADSMDNPKTVKTYDQAGNVTNVLSRRGKNTVMVYDALNRATERQYEEFRYGPLNATVQDSAQYPPPSAIEKTKPYPRYPNDATNPNGYTVFADVAKFGYDALGNMASATNRDAIVGRTYYRGGLLKTETQKIRTLAELIAGGDTTQHVYTLGYTYDLDGRRTVLTHPSQLAPSASQNKTRYAYTAAGMLDTLVDALSNAFQYSYDAQGRLSSWTLPGGASTTATYGYNDDGRVNSEVGVQGSTQFRNSILTYDHEGRLTDSQNSIGTRDLITADYTGLGQFGVGSLTSYLPGTSSYIYYDRHVGTHDALGNQRWNHHVTSKQIGMQPDNWDREDAASIWTYQLGTGRLLTTTDSAQGYAIQRDATIYDADGNVRLERSDSLIHTIRASWRDRASFYGVDGKLRAVDKRSAQWSGSADFTASFEEYRYDALGRRVLAHARQYCNNAAPRGEFDALCQRGWVRRTVWDGTNELYEIQMPYDPSHTASVENDVADFEAMPTPTQPDGLGYLDLNAFYGRVAYTSGLGTDQPASIIRMGYRSAINSASNSTTAPFVFQPFAIVPLWDTRGQAQIGTYPGGVAPCQTDGSGIRHCPVLQWPGQWLAYARPGAKPFAWHGTILEDKRDAGATHYRRNRNYDPASGRFTQEDPIGLAGGLNAYGFAGGDPVNYSDPFGLWPNWIQIASASAGFGDALLFGAGPSLRRLAGADGSVNMQSGAYLGGAIVGAVALTAATAGAGTAARTAEATVAAAGERVSAIGLNKVETEAMRAFFKSEGQELGNLSKDALLKYRAAAEKALSGEGGKKVTEKVIEQQTKRINWIDDALNRF